MLMNIDLRDIESIKVNLSVTKTEPTNSTHNCVAVTSDVYLSICTMAILAVFILKFAF